ncbi:MAG: hypothetical protein U7126_02100 [Microcoleus sp.]
MKSRLHKRSPRNARLKRREGIWYSAIVAIGGVDREIQILSLVSSSDAI